MKLSIIKLVPAGLSAAWIVPAALAGSAVSTQPEVTVPLGEIEADGGAETVDLDSAAFEGGGPGDATAVSGTIVNKTKHHFTDLTVSLEKKGDAGDDPTADNVHAGGSTATTSPTAGRVAGTVSVSVGGNEKVDFGMTGINAQGTDDMTCKLIPSFEPEVDGVAREAVSTDPFSFSQTSDLVRNGVLETWHGTVIADVMNSSNAASIVALSGEVLLPAGVTLQSVHLQDVQDDYAPVPDVMATVDGNEFDLTGFESLESGEHYLLVIVLSSPAPERMTRVDLKATYD